VTRVDELAISTQRRIVWIFLCLPFVVSLGTSATRSICDGASVTRVNVAGIYRQSFEPGCTRVNLIRVAREFSMGCTHAAPAPSTCTTTNPDPMPPARWALGVLATISVVMGLWRRTLAAITIDHGAGTVRVETDAEVAVVPIAARPEIVKIKRAFVVQASSREPIVLGKGADPRDIALLRECFASLSKT
jgi:hypothetical protein